MTQSHPTGLCCRKCKFPYELRVFIRIEENGRTGGQTGGQTDGQTDGYTTWVDEKGTIKTRKQRVT